MSTIFGPTRSPPTGWLISDGGELTPDPTVAGYLARGREVRGLCQVRDCRRRCELDFGRLVQRGLGALRVHDLKPLYRCHRLDGCALDFTERYGVELTLSTLAGRDYVSLKIACAQCRKASLVRAETVIQKLQSERTGGPDTPVDKLPELARTPCSKCQGGSWRVTVLWMDPDLIPAWRRKAAKRPPG